MDHTAGPQYQPIFNSISITLCPQSTTEKLRKHSAKSARLSIGSRLTVFLVQFTKSNTLFSLAGLQGLCSQVQYTISYDITKEIMDEVTKGQRVQSSEGDQHDVSMLHTSDNEESE